MFSKRDLRRLLIPLAIEQILAALMGIADTMMVTRVGDTAISAVSCVDSLNNVVLYLLSALATGGTIICSQYIGHEEKDRAVQAGRQVFLVSVSVSLLITLVCFTLRRGLLKLVFGAVEPAIMEQGLTYFRITAFSYPFLALSQTSAAQFRASGNSRPPMLVTALANIVNIIGNAVFLFVFRWGVAGAALSTLISRILNAVILLILQRNPDLEIPFRDYHTLRPEPRLIRLICRVAIPSGIENCLFHMGRLLVQSTVSTLGTAAIAAQAMIFTLDSIQSMPSSAIGIGLMTVVGQCVGAARFDEAKQYTKKLCLLSWVVLQICSGLILLVTAPVCRISGLSADASELTWKLMLFISAGKFLFWVPAFTLPHGLRAAGDVTFAAVVSGASMWLFRVGGSALLCRVLGVGLAGVWIAWITDWICRLIFYVHRFHSGRWLDFRVLQ